jgi:hypothetical protein
MIAMTATISSSVKPALRLVLHIGEVCRGAGAPFVAVGTK